MRTAAITATLLLLSGVFGAAQAQAPVAGTDYTEISNGRPLDPPPAGTIVVEEYFNHICPACNAFEPLFVAWAAKLPEGVKVVHVPASFRADFLPYAKAFYVAQSLGVEEKAHAAIYQAIHRSNALPREGQRPDEAKIAAFYADEYGVDEQQFLAAMSSMSVNLKVKRAADHMTRIRVPSTPTIVVNGRYLVKGNSYQDMLRIADFLIEKERTAASAAGG